ncbi:hypothetical protein [Mycobacterium sp. AT1]|uniref:hypothetical protein n=1 Tax=Mycobacterium sp. AT1 TaxID=1961706 RepID=UPI0009AC5631|nr:hypothetical protein [Mycobacterium sp. AT1]OPX12579.1 hypothetical protein B1790_03275 [Mycobacterium sp. AT1]
MGVLISDDPAVRSAASYSAVVASLKSRQVPDDDPRVIAAREGLAFHRVARAIDAEAGQIAPGHVDALVSRLRQGVAR